MLDFPEELLDDYDLIEEEEIVEEVHSEFEKQALNKYGPCKVGKWYHIIEEYSDWVAIKLQGTKVFVPYWVFS